MPRPSNIRKMISALTPAQIDQLLELLKTDPKVAKLEKRLAALDEKRERLVVEIDSLKGGGMMGKKRRRSAKSAKGASKRSAMADAAFTGAATTRKRRARSSADAAETVDAPKKRGRPIRAGVSTPEMRAAAAKGTMKKKRTPEEQARIDARMAKVRAARAAKRKNA